MLTTKEKRLRKMALDDLKHKRKGRFISLKGLESKTNKNTIRLSKSQKSIASEDPVLLDMTKNPLHFRGNLKRKLASMEKSDDLEKQFLELLKKGIKGKKWRFNRDKLYER